MMLTISGTLSDLDNHRFISHPFTVPEGTTCLDIDFEYSPKQVGDYANHLTLSLTDPERERGTGHRGEPQQHITLSQGEATPGYSAGPLPQGIWDLVINANLILPGQPLNYHFDIAFHTDVQPDPQEWPRPTLRPRGPGWYRGDLHAHTIHSDGHWDVPDLVQFARDRQLDFVSLTDHNTISPLAQMDSLATDDLLTMGGYELTTFYGHAVAFGIHQWVDWRVRPGKRTMPHIQAEVEAAGGLFIIAHPMSPGDPVCTGCHWDYTELMPGPAKIVEVWNGPWDGDSNNEDALKLWYEWLNQGYWLVATEGTDNHGTYTLNHKLGWDVVYAEEFTEAAIIEGIRQGHLYLSSGPKLSFTGSLPSGKMVMMGDRIVESQCDLSAEWEGCAAEDTIRFIINGEIRDKFSADSGTHRSWQISEKAWCLIEVRDNGGSLRAVTNPIFVGWPA